MRSLIGALVSALLVVPAVGRAETAVTEAPPPTEPAPAGEKPPVPEAPPVEPKVPAVAAKVPAPEVSHRELAGHVFIPSHFVLTPFSVTSFGMSLAVGTGTADGPANIHIDPATGAITSSGTASYPYSAFGPSLDLSIRILDFLSLRASSLSLLFSGTSGSSVLVVGSGFQFSGNVGLTGGIDFGEHVRLGITFDIASTPQFNILVLSGIADAIASGQVPDPHDLLSKTNTLSYEPGLVAAWAPWRYIGGTLNLQYVHPQKTGTSSSALNGLVLAALVDFDLMQLVHEVPLGFTATYKWTAPIGLSGVSSSQDVVGGLFYTGHKDLALGLEVGERFFHLQETLKSTATFFYITTQYYW